MFIHVKIKGITALLLNRFTDEAAEAATSGTSSSSRSNDKGSPRSQSDKKLYRDKDGTLVVPGSNMFRCIIDAGKFHKDGRSKITTQKSSLIPACVDMLTPMIPIISEEGWRVDTRPVRNPATGGRFNCHRPMFDDWSLEFTLGLDTTLLSEPLLRSIVDDAGKRIGLGDFRPDCKGMFGKFVVTKWEVEL